MANCKFKVGDKIIGNSNRYIFTCKGWKGIVTHVYPNYFNALGDGNEDHNGQFTGLNYECFDLRETADKIVITHDGKTTTATKYFGDGSKVTATAKCAPEDEFNFEVGAKLALERLDEKVNGEYEWVVVNRNVRPGDYIRLKRIDYYDMDKLGDILRVDGVDGTLAYVLEKNHPNCKPNNSDFRWHYTRSEYEVVEKRRKDKTPQYYNGKVVCVSVDSCLGENAFTVGKIYNIVDGKFISNDGESRPSTKDRITTVADLKNEYFSKWCYQFIPLVE